MTFHSRAWTNYLRENENSGTVVAIFGPSASGKSVARDVFVNNGWEKIISFTTRPPRPGSTEAENREYEFISPENFQDLYDQDRLLNVNLSYAGNSYGNDKEAIRATSNGVMITDKTSVMKLKKELKDLGKQVYTVYVTASPGELISRQEKRKETGEYESPEQLAARMKELEKEVAKDEKVQSLADYIVQEDNIQNTIDSASKLAQELLSNI